MQSYTREAPVLDSRIQKWREWLRTGNHKAFEEDILQIYNDMSSKIPVGIEITVFQDCPWTHAILYIERFSIGQVGHGYGKWDHIGEWSNEFGANMCVKRAARNLFRKLKG